MPSEEPPTAVVIQVDVPQLDAVYRDEYPSWAGLGIPLHITLLCPFVPSDAVDGALTRLAEVADTHQRFDFSLTELRTFPRTVWLKPEPSAPFVALTEALEAAFPDTPRWDGAFKEIIPHLTLVDWVEQSQLEETVLRLRHSVEPLLPLTVPAAELVVLAARRHRLPLGSKGGVI